jgi:hypothetical protein
VPGFATAQALVSVPEICGVRPENVGASERTSEEVEALFLASQAFAASSAPTAAAPLITVGSPGYAAPLAEADLQRLLRSLSDEVDHNPGSSLFPTIPTWATAPQPKPRAYTERDVYDVYDGDGDHELTESDRILRDMEVTIGTLDDRTVAIKDTVASVYRDVGSLQDQIDTVLSESDAIKAQNAALTEEVRDLRSAVEDVRTLLAGLDQTYKRRVPLSACSPDA